MPRATWKGAVLAESEQVEVLEGNLYFPRDSLNEEFFQSSSTTSHCTWKGVAGYFNVEVAGQVNRDAAWFYDDPSDAAAQIKGHVAFWKGVQVER